MGLFSADHELAIELAKGISAGDPMSFLDMSRVADEKAILIVNMTPRGRLTAVRKLIRAYGQEDDNEATAGMILTRLLAIGIIEELLPTLENSVCVSPIGYKVSYCGGHFGDLGYSRDHAAFSEDAAIQFIAFLAQDPNFDPDELKIKSIGKVSFIKIRYTPPVFN